MTEEFHQYSHRIRNIADPLLTQQAVSVRGNYDYYHFVSDGFDDRGWGCGYRSCQTLCSWCVMNGAQRGRVPSHVEIQKILASCGIEADSFVGSKQWIGSLEVGTVLQELYGVPCELLTVSSGSEVPGILDRICKHLQTQASPVMIGGATGYALTLVAVDTSRQAVLVLDPHYTGPDDVSLIVGSRWCNWFECGALFPDGAFFNFCLPIMSDAASTSPRAEECIQYNDTKTSQDWAQWITIEDHGCGR